MGFFHGDANMLQVLRICRAEMPIPRLDFADAELLATMRGEVLQINFRRSGGITRIRDEITEGIGGNSDSFARFGRELNLRTSIGSEGEPRTERNAYGSRSGLSEKA